MKLLPGMLVALGAALYASHDPFWLAHPLVASLASFGLIVLGVELNARRIKRDVIAAIGRPPSPNETTRTD